MTKKNVKILQTARENLMKVLSSDRITKMTTEKTNNEKRLLINIKYICIYSIIIMGVLIILKPWYDAWRFDNIQKQMLRMWNSEISSAEYKSDGDSWPFNKYNTWNHSVTVISDAYDADNEIWEENINPDFDKEYVIKNMDGIITIEKIKLKAPIIRKMTVGNLDISICSVIEANKMGQTGNYVLAGHKSRIYGRHFNRLTEVGIGDIITVENEFEIFKYQVSDVFTVTPSDVWVMDNDGDKKLVTLITCDYRTEPIGRLIVRGTLIE